jgi:glycerophosphoryl diester phosphodiesterase
VTVHSSADPDSGSVLAIAHRAGNSLAELQAATALGADVIEADVHDYCGNLEIRHLKTMGPLPWLWDRWELRSARAPRLGLRELLVAADHQVTFMLDLKGTRPAVGAAVARHLHEFAPGRPVLVCSRYWPALAPLEQLPWVRTIHSARTRGELAKLLRPALGASVQQAPPAPGLALRNAYGFSVHRSLLDPDTVAALHRQRPLVMTWPINDPAGLESILPYTATGTLGVISDEPTILSRLLAERA